MWHAYTDRTTSDRHISCHSVSLHQPAYAGAGVRIPKIGPRIKPARHLF